MNTMCTHSSIHNFYIFLLHITLISVVITGFMASAKGLNTGGLDILLDFLERITRKGIDLIVLDAFETLNT